MTKPLFQLGDFQFDLVNGSPQTLGWQADYRWEEQGRLLRDPANQFIGPGSQTITFDGVLYPGFSGRQRTMEELRTMAREGVPYMLTDGTGKVYGRWCIKQVQETKGVFMDNGAAREIGFSLQLVYYAEDQPGLAASPLSVQPSGVLAGLSQAAAEAAGFTAAGSAFDSLDWSQATQWQGLTQAATQSGFSLGQLASIASTGANIAAQVSSGQYVNAALNTFGLFGFDAAQSDGWAQIGINAGNLAQSYANGQGNSGMSVALEAVARLGAPTLAQVGVISQENVAPIGQLFNAAATVGTILNVDPRITSALSTSILLP